MTQTMTRRVAMGSALALATAAAAPAVTPFPDGATLLVAGPAGGPVDGWASWLTPTLARALPPGTTLRKDLVGGVDGVTGANQFETRTVPDGGTVLMLPGSAAMAWLVGDPRARFDVAQWIPALAGVTPGLLVSNIPYARMAAGVPIRVAVSGPAGPELPALLALDLLGVPFTPIFGLSDAAASEAIAGGQADAICLSGRRVPELAQLLAATGANPVFSYGSVDDSGQRLRDPAFPDTPDVSELLSRRSADPAMGMAWRATAAAAELEMALVLPRLTPAAMVALWRRACAQAVTPLQEQASALGVRALGASGAAANTTALQADAAAQMALRDWLANRLNYRPA